MFYYLDGKVAHTEPNLAVIDCGGAGYAVHTSTNTVSALKLGEKAKIYTFLNVREGVFELYGFRGSEELSCFKLLLGISGVGPKAALAILSVASPERISLAVISGNEKLLTQAAGVGKKLAQRIILELKDKLAKQSGNMRDMSEGYYGGGGETSENEAVSALMVLGYNVGEAVSALRGIDEALPTEAKIKLALRKMI